MIQDEPTHAVETIADTELYEAVCDAVNTVGTREEAAFEFFDDRLQIRVKDPANVAMVSQTLPADAFDHYAVGGDRVTIGINTATFDDLLDAADSETVEFNLNSETRKFEFQSPAVEYELSGVDPDSMTDSPVDVPPLKDEYDWVIDVTLDVDLWEQGTDIIDLAGSGHGTFRYPGDGTDLYLEGEGDKDTSRVNLSDSDAFEWNESPPDHAVEVVQSNEYMPELISVIEADTVRFVTGDELPYHVFTERADGRIDTRILQAPRIVS